MVWTELRDRELSFIDLLLLAEVEPTLRGGCGRYCLSIAL
jgi:hypothetical protein